MRLLGGDPSAKTEEVSSEELQDIVRTHEELGDEQRRILADVFAAATRTLKEVMRPRTEVQFVRAQMRVTDAIEMAASHPYSRYPVIGESFDDVTGFIHVRDLLNISHEDRRTVADLQREILALPATNRLLPSVSLLRESGTHIAVVVDEYGGTDGIVTLEDLVEEIVGEIRDEYDLEPPASPPEHDALEVDGGLNIEDFAELTGLTLPDGDYETVAGFLISLLGRVPAVGDHVDLGHHRLEVVVMDGRRVTRIRVSDIAIADESAEGGSPGPSGVS